MNKMYCVGVGPRAKIQNMMFRPLGMRQQDVDYQVLSSKFKQPFGLFEGKITYQQNTYVIQDQPGVVEEHLAVW